MPRQKLSRPVRPSCPSSDSEISIDSPPRLTRVSRAQVYFIIVCSVMYRF